MAFIARLLLIWAVLSAPAMAQINEVEVIAQTAGSSPLDAKQKAIDYAQKRAFFLTLSKFAPDRANAIAESLTTEQIMSIVRGYELMDEKIYRDRPNEYLAKYKVSVSESMVRRLLADDGAAQTSEANPMVIFPVLRDAEGNTLLWESENVWRSIWNGVALERGEGILVVPYGDPTDTLYTNNANILSLGYEDLKPFTERYGTGEAVVVVATLATENTPPGVEIIMNRLGPDVNKSKQLYFETDGRNTSPTALLPNAARDVAQQLKEIARTYQGNQLKRIANANRKTIRASFTRLAEWVSIKNKLEALPRVVELRIGQIGIENAEAELLFEATPEMMMEIMAAAGLYLKADGNVWEVMVP